MNTEVLEWLLASDPSIVFQTKRDLLDLPASDYINDQNIISTKGWGKQLLDLQDSEGTWGSGLYGPKFISTHYTLMLLRRMEMPPNIHTRRGCEQLIKIPAIGKLEQEVTKPRSIDRDACITGMGLGILAHFQFADHNIFRSILDYLKDQKIVDGAWNCRHPRVKTSHSSVHTTLLVLEGLAILKKNYPRYKTEVEELVTSAHEFLLVHKLFRSHRTGEIIHQDMIDISFPPRWKYNILTALDYCRSIDFDYDERMQDAIDIIKSKEKNGYWGKGKQMSGKKFFSLNQPRKPSEWNTLRALRVLKTYD